MTDNALEVRRRAFLAAMQAAEQTHGVTVIAVAQSETRGGTLLVKPVLRVVPLQGWRPPDDENESSQ